MSLQRRPTTYAADLLWCHAHLSAGRRVWCVRTKVTGLIVHYLAGEIAGAEVHDDQPVSQFTVQPVVIGHTGSPVFGPESAWPRGGGDADDGGH